MQFYPFLSNLQGTYTDDRRSSNLKTMYDYHSATKVGCSC